ncbi:MAG: DUF4160 domain-containing protein [Pelolinea sp.]|nr:DUF4160 domain-containing protein [Pelolinea sp.]
MNEIKLEIKKRYYRHPLEGLTSFQELSLYLESLLNDSCSVMLFEGELVLLEIKALVDNVRGMRIEIYPNEHQPPHFHIKSSDFQASFRIDDCSLIAGNINGGNYRKILYWYEHAKPKLIEIWNKTRPTNCIVGVYQG